MNKNVLLFGGAFDPPHVGHIAVALRALDHALETTGKVHDLWFLPCYSDAFGTKKMSASEHRLSMLGILVLDILNDQRIGVCTHELEMMNEAGTYAVVLALKEKYPNYNFKYVIGSDQARQIRKWRNSRALLRTIPFIVLQRPGSFPLFGSHWYHRKPHNYVSKNITKLKVSSSDLRRSLSDEGYRDLVRNGHEIAGLYPQITRYILEHDLYKAV